MYEFDESLLTEEDKEELKNYDGDYYYDDCKLTPTKLAIENKYVDCGWAEYNNYDYKMCYVMC